MRWLCALALVVACAPVEGEESLVPLDTGEATLDTGEEPEPLPELGSRVEGVTVAALVVVGRTDGQWNNRAGAYMGAVLLPDENTLSYLTWASEHCEVYEDVSLATSVEGRSPLDLHTSLVQATATYLDGKYRIEGVDRVPFAAEDQLMVRHGEEVEIEVPSPPALGPEALGEPQRLATTLHIPHDDFDAVQLQINYGHFISAYCLYGKADMEPVDGGWELPLADEEAQMELPLNAGSDVLIYLVNLEMTDQLFPGAHSVPVKAVRGLALAGVDLLPD